MTPTRNHEEEYRQENDTTTIIEKNRKNGQLRKKEKFQPH